MRLAQESLFQNREVNPLQYGEYSKSIQGPQENPEGKIYTPSELRAARNRLHRGTKPENFFGDKAYAKTSAGYQTPEWYAEPYKPGMTMGANEELVRAYERTLVQGPALGSMSESSPRGGTRPTKDTELGDGLDDSNQELYKKLVRANQGVLKTPTHNDKQVGVSVRPSLMQGYRKDLSGIMSTVSSNAQPIRKARIYTRSWARQAEGFGEGSIPIEEVSAKAKLAYLRRKLKRRYFKRKPTAVAFQDVVMPADDSLTEGYVPDAHAEIYDVNDHVATLVAVRDTVTNSDGSGVDIPRGAFFTRDKDDLYLTANAHSDRKIKPKVGMQLHDDDGTLYNNMYGKELKKAPHNPITLKRMRDIASGKRRLGNAG